MGRTVFGLILAMAIAVKTDAGGPVPGKYSESGQTMNRVRIASVSAMPEKWNKEANWAKIERMAREAAERFDPDMVVTPEGVLEGYVINKVNAVTDPADREAIVKRFIELAEPLDGPYIQKARALASELGVFFVLGFLERRGEELFNSAILIDPEGDIIGRYGKTHFAQGYTVNPPCYVPGNEYPVFDTPFGKVGVIICYDRQLPEPARILALRGAQILLAPSYGGYDDGNGWNTTLLRTRAYENKFPLVFSHPSQSLLIGSGGEIRAMCGEDDMVCYEIDTSPDRYEGRFRNRRPSTYGEIAK